MIQEWWGLVGHIASVADRLAAAGFLALAPDLFHGHDAREPDEAQKLLMGLAMDQAAKDIAGAAAYLAGPDVHGRRRRRRVLHGRKPGAVGGHAVRAHHGGGRPIYPAIPWERMQPSWQNYSGKAALIHADEAEGGSPAPPASSRPVQLISDAGGEATVLPTTPAPGTPSSTTSRPEVYNETPPRSAGIAP